MSHTLVPFWPWACNILPLEYDLLFSILQPSHSDYDINNLYSIGMSLSIVERQKPFHKIHKYTTVNSLMFTGIYIHIFDTRPYFAEINIYG